MWQCAAGNSSSAARVAHTAIAAAVKLKAVPVLQHASTPCLCHPLQAPLDDLLRDFANPRNNDRYFPVARHMDWFDGHSWASGYTVFAAGKNQVRQPCAPLLIVNTFVLGWF